MAFGAGLSAQEAHHNVFKPMCHPATAGAAVIFDYKCFSYQMIYARLGK